MTSEILFDFFPLARVYNGGRVERYSGEDFHPPAVDPLTGVESKDVKISSDDVSARLYLPKINKTDEKLPLLVYFHGGGFIIESAFSATYHKHMNSIAAEANVVIVSVDYRRAPENPLPAAYDDSWLALQWVVDSPDSWLKDYADFNQGIRWQIGNGRAVSIWNHPWIPIEPTFCAHRTETVSLEDDALVEKLIVNGRWDVNLIHSNFMPHEADAILDLPLRPNYYHDKMIWHYSKKGTYTVKEGYKLALLQKHQSRHPCSSSSNHHSKKAWNYLWGLQIPPKIKSFLWRIASKAIAFGSNLLHRKIGDGHCKICRSEVETWQHCFFNCKWIKNFWRSGSGEMDYATMNHGNFLDLCLHLSDQPAFDGDSFALILWFIWGERNRFVFEGHPPSTDRIRMQADALQTAYQILMKTEHKPSSLIPFATSWVKPPDGSVKLNVDAGFRDKMGTAGVLLRDSNGKILMAMSLMLGFVATVEEAESLAIHFGIIEAARMRSGNIIVESDSSESIARLNCEEDDFTHLGTLVLRTKRVCRMFDSYSFSLVRRNCNVPADKLAKLGFSIPTHLAGYCNWGVNPPSDVISAVLADVD